MTVQCPASGCLVDPPTVGVAELPCPTCGATVRVGGTRSAPRYSTHNEPTLGDMVARWAAGGEAS